jgi:hypothetical protein
MERPWSSNGTDARPPLPKNASTVTRPHPLGFPLLARRSEDPRLPAQDLLEADALLGASAVAHGGDGSGHLLFDAASRSRPYERLRPRMNSPPSA